MYSLLGTAPVSLIAILILTPQLRSHPSTPVRTAKIESHAGTREQRKMIGKIMLGKVSQKAGNRERKLRKIDRRSWKPNTWSILVAIL